MWIAAVAGLLLAAEPSLAFRCGNRIVSEGDHYTKVRRFCGEPTGVQERVIVRSGITRPRFRMQTPGGLRYERELLFPDRSYEEVVVQEWTYNRGPRRLMRLVRFENGFVTDVEQLGYGYRED